ncbi:MAG: hypothetical protein ABJO09_14220 [Hyphomicrobiales bacterium]
MASDCSRRHFLGGVAVTALLGIGIPAKKANALPAAVPIIIFAAQTALSIMRSRNNPAAHVSKAQLTLLFSIHRQLVQLNSVLETALVVLRELYVEQGLIPNKTIAALRVNEANSYWITHNENKRSFFDPNNIDYTGEEFLDDTEEIIGKVKTARNQLILISSELDYSPIIHICTLQQTETSAWLDMMSDQAFELNRPADIVQLKNALSAYVEHYDECMDPESPGSIAQLNTQLEQQHAKLFSELSKNPLFLDLQEKERSEFLGCRFETGETTNPLFETQYYCDDLDYHPDKNSPYIAYADLDAYHIQATHKKIGFDMLTKQIDLNRNSIFRREIPIDECDPKIDQRIERLVTKADYEMCEGRDFSTDWTKISELRLSYQDISPRLDEWNRLSTKLAASRSLMALVSKSRKDAICQIIAIESGDFTCL